MRIYWSWADRDYDDSEAYDLEGLTNEVEEIIKKYESISEKTCVVCGKEYDKSTTPRSMPMCDCCFEDEV